jgi:hypothetical protein
MHGMYVKTAYRVIQEERPISWKIIVSVVVIKNVHMIMCLILNGYITELFESTNEYKALRMEKQQGKLFAVNCILI